MSTPDAERRTTAASGELGVDAENAQPADLELQVIDRARDDRHFICTVSSPWLPDTEPEEWVLPDKAGELVTAYMKEFTAKGIEPASRLLSLRGAGVELWRDAAPEAFRHAVTVLTGIEKLETIQIVSEERNIPWELMIPDDGDERPLGVRHSISRWFERPPMRAAGAPAANARVAAPNHNMPPARLKHAKSEAELVRDALAGDRLDSTSAAKIATQLQAWDGTVLHFVCHGVSGPPQALYLDGMERLTSTQVSAMSKLRETWCRSAPVVFLNACEVGRPAPALSGAGGLVKSWADVGAGAVIAPLWSVRDETAHKIACEFYRRITTEPATTYAEIVRDIRAKAYDLGDDSYAAYCYFGSPAATAGPS